MESGMDNSGKIILDLAGGSGSWSRPYKEAGYTVFVITLPEYDVLEAYFNCGYLNFPRLGGQASYFEIKNIYGILAAPVCTHFSRARSNAKTPRNLEEGMVLVRACMDIIWTILEKQGKLSDNGIPNLQFWALENPMGVLRRFLGRPDFTFNPCDFGDPWTKKTDIWGWFNKPTKKPVWPTIGSKIHLMAPSPDRVAKRSITPPGFSKAFFKANR